MTSNQRYEAVLRKVAVQLSASMAIERAPVDRAALANLALQPLYGGAIEIGGREIDSLALTEVLIGAEEDLAVNLLDDDRADDLDTVGDLVELVISRVPAESLDTWLASASGP